MPSTPSRAERIGALLRHAPDDELVRELLADVEAIVRSVLGPRDPHLLLTAAHDALLAVVRYRHGFRGDGAASTWLFTLTRREALRAVGREARRQRLEIALDDEAFEGAMRSLATTTTPDAALVATETLEERVANPDWRRIWLLYNEPGAGRDHAAVAGLCARTERTVAVTLSRVRALLRDTAIEEVA